MDKDRVLILDGKYTLYLTILSALNRAGYEVDIAEDSITGLQKICSNGYQLVIVREGEAETAWLQCLEIHQMTNIPIIVISWDKRKEALVRNLSAGADYFLIEPLDPLELVARINALLRRSKLNKGPSM